MHDIEGKMRILREAGQLSYVPNGRSKQPLAKQGTGAKLSKASEGAEVLEGSDESLSASLAGLNDGIFDRDRR